MAPNKPIDLRLKRLIHVRWNGELSTGPITIGPIHWLPDKRRWVCFWSIHRIHTEQAKIYGDDPLQALDRTIDFVAKLIRGSIEDGIESWWLNEGDECGFSGTS